MMGQEAAIDALNYAISCAMTRDGAGRPRALHATPTIAKICAMTAAAMAMSRDGLRHVSEYAAGAVSIVPGLVLLFIFRSSPPHSIKRRVSNAARYAMPTPISRAVTSSRLFSPPGRHIPQF